MFYLRDDQSDHPVICVKFQIRRPFTLTLKQMPAKQKTEKRERAKTNINRLQIHVRCESARAAKHYPDSVLFLFFRSSLK